jgi:uncharacterized protein (DUF2267 family)
VSPYRADAVCRVRELGADDAADIAAAVVEAVAASNITPGEAAEIGKVLEIYVKAYQAAELDDRSPRLEQISDEELMRIIRNGGENSAPRLLTIGPG